MNPNITKHTADFENLAVFASTMDAGNWEQTFRRIYVKLYTSHALYSMFHHKTTTPCLKTNKQIN